MINAPFSNRAKYIKDNHPEIFKKWAFNQKALTKEERKIIHSVCERMPYKI